MGVWLRGILNGGEGAVTEGWQVGGKGVWRSALRGGRRGMPFSTIAFSAEMRKLGVIGVHLVGRHE